jgi:hypothetical protein
MGGSQTIVVQQDFDVITARSRVRDLARHIGMSTADQARISLATSSIARALRLGQPHQGQIVIDKLNGSERLGVRVVCTMENSANGGSQPYTFTEARSMVDTLTVDTPLANEIQITLIQWLKEKRTHSEQRGTK